MKAFQKPKSDVAKRTKVSAVVMRFVKRYAERLKRIRAAPSAVAGGVALGMFWAFTPLVGLKTLLAVLCAWAFRWSKVSAALAVTFHDILTPVWPVFLRWEYQIGFWVLSHPHHFPARLHEADVHIRYWLRWSTLEILWPTLVGSQVFAVPAALLSFWVVERLLRRHFEKRDAGHCHSQ